MKGGESGVESEQWGEAGSRDLGGSHYLEHLQIPAEIISSLLPRVHLSDHTSTFPSQSLKASSHSLNPQ